MAGRLASPESGLRLPRPLGSPCGCRCRPPLSSRPTRS